MDGAPKPLIRGGGDPGRDISSQPGKNEQGDGGGDETKEKLDRKQTIGPGYLWILRHRSSIAMIIRSNRRGITVLALVLILIAVIVAGIFLLSYLRQPA